MREWADNHGYLCVRDTAAAQSNSWSAKLWYRSSTILTMDILVHPFDALPTSIKIPNYLPSTSRGLTRLPLSPTLTSLVLMFSTSLSLFIFGQEWTRLSHPRIPYNNASLIRHVCPGIEYTIVAATVLECFDSVKHASACMTIRFRSSIVRWLNELW